MDYTHRQEAPHPSFARTFLRRAEYFFFFIGLAALAYVGYTLVQTRVYQETQSRQLEKAPTTPTTDMHAPAVGAVIGKVEVARIGLEAVVVQGDSDPILRLAVGHIPGTALPGQTGNMVLAGHRDTFFRPLRNIRSGDRIVFETFGGTYEYEVESASVVAPTDVSVLRSSDERELTLITCYPFSWIGTAPDRFVVRASKVQ